MILNRIPEYFKDIDETARTLQQVRSRLVNQSLLFILIMGLPGIATSLLAVVTVGWYPIMLVEIVLYLIALVVFLFRKKIPFIARTAWLLGSFYLLGVAGIYAFGLVSVAFLMLVAFCLLTAVLLGTRPAIISLLMSLTAVSIIGLAFLNGSLVMMFDVSLFINSASAWILAFIGVTIVAGYSIIGVGITQAHLERALRRSETQFRQLIEDSPFGIVIQSDNQIKYVNPQMLQIARADSAETIIGRSSVSLITPDYQSQTKERLRRLNVERQETPPIHSQMIRLDGSIANITMQSRPMTYQNRPSFYTIINDVTEKAAMDAALRESEARYRNIFQSTAVSIWEEDYTELVAVIDAMKAEGVTDFAAYFDQHPQFVREAIKLIKVLNVNDATLEMYEAENKDEVLTTSNHAFNHKNDHSLREEIIAIATDGIHFSAESIIQTLKGNEINILISARFPTANEQWDKVQVSITNITKQKQAEEERINIEAHLRQGQKLESIGTLASGVAHEINNPLTGIMNYAQLIYDRIDPAEKQLREFSAGIVDETERVAEIVRNLLTFSRQDKQSHSLANMSDIMDSTLSLVRTIIKRDQIVLEVDVPDELPPLRCRSQQIQQVLMNLLTNARDALNGRYPNYDPNKIILVTVRPFEKDGQRWLRTTIEDHGVGIPPEIRERIFDPFYTTKSRAMGTGLGLSISLGIVQDHHGELTFESVENQFTRFYLELPEE